MHRQSQSTSGNRITILKCVDRLIWLVGEFPLSANKTALIQLSPVLRLAMIGTEVGRTASRIGDRWIFAAEWRRFNRRELEGDMERLGADASPASTP
jgi:hypothetical protein